MKILVINAGSSSLKYQLLDPDTKEVLAKGLCERIGLDGHIKHTPTGKDVYDADRYMPDHEAAIKLVMEVLTHNYYGVIKDMLRINENLDLGGVREPLPQLEEADLPIAQEAARMVKEAVAGFCC